MASIVAIVSLLHYPMVWCSGKIGTPNLTLKEEQWQYIEAVYQGNSVFVWSTAGFGSKLFGGKREEE